MKKTSRTFKTQHYVCENCGAQFTYKRDCARHEEKCHKIWVCHADAKEYIQPDFETSIYVDRVHTNYSTEKEKGELHVEKRPVCDSIHFSMKIDADRCSEAKARQRFEKDVIEWFENRFLKTMDVLFKGYAKAVERASAKNASLTRHKDDRV